MIIIPVPFRTAFRKIIRKESEITGVDCKVNTVVSFPETITIVPRKEEIGFDSIRTLKTLEVDRKYKPKTSYMFGVEVSLTKEEYDIFRHNLEEYVCRKAKKQNDYQKLLEECLDKEPNYMGYTIETYMPMTDPDVIKFKTIKHEYEEYIPI